MKKYIWMIASLVLFAGCGVGNYTISSGREDVAYIAFTDQKKYDIMVVIDDNQSYNVETIKNKPNKSRKIKQTIENTIEITPGQHYVEVKQNGEVLFSQKIYVSTNESKIIEL